MSTGAITRRDHEITSLRHRLTSLRARGEKTAERVQHTAVAAAAAFLYGGIEKRASSTGAAVPTLFGLPPLLTWSLASYVGGNVVGGRMGELAEAAADGLISVYAYQLGADTGARQAAQGGAGT